MARRIRLTKRRIQQGHTQESLAEAVGVTRVTVKRWEEGAAAPRPRQRRPLADSLDLSLDQLNDLLEPDDSTSAGTLGDVDPRAFLAGFGGSLATTFAQLEDAAVSADTGGQRQAALRLLGHTHHAAGESAFDRLDLSTAADHFHQAHEIGVELGDPDMIANSQIQLGDVSRRQHRYRTALRLLHTAERHTAAAGVLSQLRRCQTLARAYAEMGDRSKFDRAIDRAEELANGISPEHHREGDHSPRGMRLERGQGLTLLGEPAAALAIYERSAPPTFRTDRERGSFLIIHAQALAHAGYLDEGVRVAIEGVQLARSYHSPRHVSRVQRMYDRLVQSWSPSEPPLVALHDALAA